MEGGALAIAILIIVIFVAFILWAKTTAGQKSLRNTFGEPSGHRHRPRATKRGSSTGAKTGKSGKSTSR